MRPMKIIRFWGLCVSLALGRGAVTLAAPEAPPGLPDTVQFNRDIRPILSENCYKCLGPDAKAREAHLRFDTRDGIFTKLEEGRVAVAPGNLSRSELWKRIRSTDRDEKM